MWVPSCLGLCTCHTGIHKILHPLQEVIVEQIADMELSLQQFQGFWGTSKCKVVHCFYYLARDGHRNHCTTIHPDMGMSPLWFMPLVDAILFFCPDTPVQAEFQVGLLSVVQFPILIQDTTRCRHIDRCDGSNQGVGSIRRLPHHMSHTMEVWILKELGTLGLLSLRTTVRIIRLTVEVQDTTRVNLMVIQAIRTLTGVRSEWPMSRKGVLSHLGPVLWKEQSISCPLGIQLVRSGRLQAGALIVKSGVLAGQAQIAVPAAVTMAVGRMAARGSKLTPFARYGQQVNEGIISALFLGFAVLIPLEVGVRTMGVGVAQPPRRVGPPAHPVRDMIVLTGLVYDKNVLPGKKLMSTAAKTQGPSHGTEILLVP